MKCIVCKQAETHPGNATVTLERNDVTLVIKGVRAQICPNCGEEYEFETYQEMADFASEQYEKHDGCKSCCEEEAA